MEIIKEILFWFFLVSFIYSIYANFKLKKSLFEYENFYDSTFKKFTINGKLVKKEGTEINLKEIRIDAVKKNYLYIADLFDVETIDRGNGIIDVEFSIIKVEKEQ